MDGQRQGVSSTALGTAEQRGIRSIRFLALPSMLMILVPAHFRLRIRSMVGRSVRHPLRGPSPKRSTTQPMEETAGTENQLDLLQT